MEFNSGFKGLILRRHHDRKVSLL